MSYLIWYNLTVLKVHTTVCGNVISIHAVCVLFYKYSCGVLFYKFFTFVVILIHNYSTIFVQS
jgi:hypothetical protein